MDAFRLTRLHALALLDFAHYNDLPDVYRQVMTLVLSGQIAPEGAETQELKEMLEPIPPEDLEEVLLQFLDMARMRMDSIPVEIISAVPLTEEQLYRTETALIRLTRRQLDISATVDPSLLGGLRIIVENTVIDASIKRKLSDLKKAVYKGVYLN